MALNDTIDSMKKLLEVLSKDLSKATKGNKAASQRVRTGTIMLEKVSKLFRKESVAAAKSAPKKAKKKAAPKKAKKKAAPKKSGSKKAPKRASKRVKARPAKRQTRAKVVRRKKR